MADDLEKTEDPSENRLREAKDEGNVANSRDISGVVALFIAVIAIFISLPLMMEQLNKVFNDIFALTSRDLKPTDLMQIFISSSVVFIIIVLAISIPVAIFGILGNILQFGVVFSTKPITPNLNKISPLKGIKNLLSIDKLLEALKIIFKSFTTLGVGFFLFFIFVKELPTITLFNMFDQLQWLEKKSIIIVSIMLLIMFIFALIDLVIVRNRYKKKLRMSVQEVKDEFKKLEGDPAIKAKVKEIQRKMAKGQMLNNVKDATVVITNPTHYAVALKYDIENFDKNSELPKIVTKGVDFLALRIRELAREYDVLIYEDPPLARALYKIDIDQEIPDKLFDAVVQVLVYVMQVNNSKT